MPDNAKPASPRPVLTATEAQLFVADVAASCAFYQDTLGFAVEFIYGDPPFYAMVVRDRARLTLRGVDEPVFIPGVREREGLLSASLTLATAAETQQLFHTYEAAGAPMQQPLKQEAWGATTFVVKDPDGNLILFAGPAE